jgi:hypothetical protein
MKRKFSLKEISEAVWQWLLLRPELRRSKVFAAYATKCCVSKVENSNVGSVRDLILGCSVIAAVCMNGWFFRCTSAPNFTLL